MTFFLTERDVGRLLPMSAALEAVEQVLLLQGEGQAVNNPRSRVKVPDGSLHLMGAAVPAWGLLGFKAYTAFRGGARFLFCLFSASDGELLAMMEADRLGQMRTGAASGIATKYMARAGATRVGVLGSGWQARSQLEAVAAVRRISGARVWSRTDEHRRRFAEEMSVALGLSVEPAMDPASAVEGADIVITATSARDPVLLSEMVPAGTHVNAMGNNSLVRREVDERTILRSAVVAVDSLEQAKLEAGEFLPLIEAGKLHWEQIVELGGIVAGRVPGRRGEDEITLFKSLGIAIEDVAVAREVYQRAEAEGWRNQVSFWQ